MNDMESRSGVELRILEAFGRVELSVRTARIVQDLGQCALDVRIVVKRLVVVAALASVSFDEDGVGAVHHDLPDVVVGQEWGQWSVPGDVAKRSLGDNIGFGEVKGAKSASIVNAPTLDLGVDQISELLIGSGFADV